MATNRDARRPAFPRMPLTMVRTTPPPAADIAEARATNGDLARAKRPSTPQIATISALPPQELSRVTEHVIRPLDRRVLSYRERPGRSRGDRMSLEKALLTNTATGARIAVQFNPEEYTLSRDINYAQAAIPGLSAPILQFVNGNMQTLEMELFLDSYEQHKAGAGGQLAQTDVRLLVRQVTDLMSIEPSTHAPPVLLFTWGSLTFTCVLARAASASSCSCPTARLCAHG